MLGIGWEDAEATIVSRRDVRPDDGSESFRAGLKEPFNAITFKAPEVGQVVRVKYNHKHEDTHKVRFDRADPGTYEHVPGVPDWRHHGDPLKEGDRQAVADAHSAEAQAAWDATLNAPPDK